MKNKGIFIFLCLSICITAFFTGCSKAMESSEIYAFPEPTFQIELRHIAQGQEKVYYLGQEEFDVNDSSLQPVFDWYKSLELVEKDYPEDEHPSQSVGGEAYIFNINGEEVFSYVNHGETAYIVTDKWYEVKNPSIFDLESVKTYEPKEIEAETEIIDLILQDFSPTGVSFIINNGSKTPYTYGEEYYLETLENKEWKEVSPIVEYMRGEDVKYGLGANTITEEISVDWSWLYGQLPDGEYRFIKEVVGSNGNEKIFDEFQLIHGNEVKVSSYLIEKLDSQNNVISQKSITDKDSMALVETTKFNVLIKSSRLEIDTSNVVEFYKITTIYNNEETSDMTFYEKDGVAYSDGTVCDYDLYKAMIGLLE